MLLGVAPRLVPAPQVDALQALVRRYLAASALDDVNKEAGALEFGAVRGAAATLPEPSATLARYLADRDVVHLGARLLPYIDAFGGNAALSVSRSPKPWAPVFLLHGSDDTVIPPLESEYLANDLRGHGPVRLLLSGLISHAAADRPARAPDVLQLADFWGDVLSR
jgi:pimeloyl-ACP methyl ester carboxylesterase